jgi:hypothetical protein
MAIPKIPQRNTSAEYLPEELAVLSLEGQLKMKKLVAKSWVNDLKWLGAYSETSAATYSNWAHKFQYDSYPEFPEDIRNRLAATTGAEQAAVVIEAAQLIIDKHNAEIGVLKTNLAAARKVLVAVYEKAANS